MLETKLRKELPFTWNTAGRESPGFLAMTLVFGSAYEDEMHSGVLEDEILAGLNNMLCMLSDQPASLEMQQRLEELLGVLEEFMPNATFENRTLGITLKTRQGFEITVEHRLGDNK